MSDSGRPHRRQPTRLHRLQDSPGKKTGVGCHFLLQCMKVKSESEVAQSCLILSDPMDCSLPGSSVPGIFQARVLEWGTIAFSVNRQYLDIYPLPLEPPSHPHHPTPLGQHRALGWKKRKLESRFPGKISITSDMQMTPPLWQKVKRN